MLLIPLFSHLPSAMQVQAGLAVTRPHQLQLTFQLQHCTPELVSQLAQGAEAGQRQDYLWQGNCLETFIGFAGGNYLEFNLAPNGAWNVYQFEDYRTPATLPPSPANGAQLTAFNVVPASNDRTDGFTVTACFDVSQSLVETQQYNLAMVSAGPPLLYWAPGHAQPAPDFHNRQYWNRF